MCNTDKSVFYTFSTETCRDIPMQIQMAGEEYCQPLYHIKRRNSQIGVLCCVISGKGTIIVEKDTFSACAGDIFILERGSNHEYYVDALDPWHTYWFNIDGGLFSFLIDSYGLQGQTIFRQAKNTISDLFKTGIAYCSSYKSNDEIQKKLILIITEIILELSADYKMNMRMSSEPCEKIRQYLDKQLTQPYSGQLSLKSMSLELNMSEKQITRIFKKEIQCTPYDYFLNKRILQAKQYLQNTSMSIKEISLKLGFCDQYYFSSFFKSKTGVCPKKYKQNI